VTPALVQWNPYRGAPERAFIRVRLRDARGMERDLELLADTGNPCAIIVGRNDTAFMAPIPGYSVWSNFGALTAGWLQVVIPEIGFDQQVLGYASDEVVGAAQESDPDFGGLIGLPLLRMMQYGGDSDSFWIRPAGNDIGLGKSP